MSRADTHCLDNLRPCARDHMIMDGLGRAVAIVWPGREERDRIDLPCEKNKFDAGAGFAIDFIYRGSSRFCPQSANIESFGDALWWALVTMLNLGYGDLYPVTGVGRIIGAGLMICGVALLRVVTATLAFWLVDRVQDIEEDSQTARWVSLASLNPGIERPLASSSSRYRV